MGESPDDRARREREYAVVRAEAELLPLERDLEDGQTAREWVDQQLDQSLAVGEGDVVVFFNGPGPMGITWGPARGGLSIKRIRSGTEAASKSGLKVGMILTHIGNENVEGWASTLHRLSGQRWKEEVTKELSGLGPVTLTFKRPEPELDPELGLEPEPEPEPLLRRPTPDARWSPGGPGPTRACPPFSMPFEDSIELSRTAAGCPEPEPQPEPEPEPKPQGPCRDGEIDFEGRHLWRRVLLKDLPADASYQQGLPRGWEARIASQRSGLWDPPWPGAAPPVYYLNLREKRGQWEKPEVYQSMEDSGGRNQRVSVLGRVDDSMEVSGGDAHRQREARLVLEADHRMKLLNPDGFGERGDRLFKVKGRPPTLRWSPRARRRGGTGPFELLGVEDHGYNYKLRLRTNNAAHSHVLVQPKDIATYKTWLLAWPFGTIDEWTPSSAEPEPEPEPDVSVVAGESRLGDAAPAMPHPSSSSFVDYQVGDDEDEELRLAIEMSAAEAARGTEEGGEAELSKRELKKAEKERKKAEKEAEKERKKAEKEAEKAAKAAEKAAKKQSETTSSPEAPTCAICLEHLPRAEGRRGRNATQALPCGHNFHKECIKEWLQKRQMSAVVERNPDNPTWQTADTLNDACPVCRVPLPPRLLDDLRF